VFSCRNPEESCDSFFFKLLERNCDSAPIGKLPGALPGNWSVLSSVEIDIGFKNKCTSYFCPNISTLLFNIINMVHGHHSSSSSTNSSPLDIVIEFRRSSPQPPTSLSPSHTHTLLATAATVSSSSLALVHHHRTIPHLSFVGNKAPHTTHQTNMSVEEGYDDYDHMIID